MASSGPDSKRKRRRSANPRRQKNGDLGHERSSLALEPGAPTASTPKRARTRREPRSARWRVCRGFAGPVSGVLRSIALGEGDTHDHAHDDEPTSTGFLPISLAIGLFVTGLFVLGYVSCAPTDAFELLY